MVVSLLEEPPRSGPMQVIARHIQSMGFFRTHRAKKPGVPVVTGRSIGGKK